MNLVQNHQYLNENNISNNKSNFNNSLIKQFSNKSQFPYRNMNTIDLIGNDSDSEEIEQI